MQVHIPMSTPAGNVHQMVWIPSFLIKYIALAKQSVDALDERQQVV